MKMKIFSLLVKHQRLDTALREARMRPWPDVVHILKLKKMKLAVKDQLRAFAKAKAGLRRT